MKAKTILQLTIIISALLAQLTFAALPRYEIIDLGTLGGSYSEAWSINDSYQIVGWSANDLGARHATLFDPTGEGKNIDLGTLGGNQSEAYSISNSGQIVGSAENSSGNSHAILFDPTGNGNNTDLGMLSGYLRSGAKGISDNGQIVGYSLVVEGSYYHYRATLFDPTGNGNNLDLGTIGGSSSIACSINNNGRIVGSAQNSSGNICATLFDSTDGVNNINLGTLGGTYSVAMLINNNEKIVGMATNISDDNRATLFDATGASNNMDLGTLPGFSWSHAWSINDKGQIVGDVQVLGGTPEHLRATLFDPTGNGNNIDLNTLINPASGWTLNRVISINNSGWIVGAGDNPNGKYHAYLLKPIPPKVIYVDDDAAGANDGSSWNDAFNYLQDALAIAYYGDEIRVAQGTYKPDRGVGQTPGDREATFQLINGVTIKGGYAGTGAPDPNARDIDLYETILSGDLEDNDVDIENFEWETLYDFTSHPSRDDNSYTVVTGNDTDTTAILDGFTITAGHANNPDADYGSPENNGGGMYNESGSPTLINCTFKINTIQSIWNSAGTRGGGMYNSNSSPTLRHCCFIENIVFSGDVSSQGGGMCNINSHPALTKCVFRHNIVTGFDDEYYGGGICNYNSNPTLTDCSFIDNSAEYSTGGAICNYDKSCPVLTGCLFQGNKAIRGGAISGGNSKLTDCIFRENTAGDFGGGINGGGNSTLTNCIFIRNSAGHRGGGMCNYYNSSPMLINCTFIQNTTTYEGGGMYNLGSSPMLINCTFGGNSTYYNEGYNLGGGGMSNTYGSPTLVCCIFIGNSAGGHGGGIFNYNSSPTLTGCTFTGNVAPKGNALACYSYMQKYPSNLQATNCILWDGGDEIWNGDDSTITITYSDIQGGWPGEGNIDSVPLFVDPGYWDANGTPDDANDDVWVDGDYHLLPGSPCINTGDPNYIAGPNETDLDGRPRVIGGRIDMGAYETPIFAEARILPRTINLASKGKWITCYIWLSDDYDVADIEPGSVMFERQIKPEQFSVDEDKQIATVIFDREKVRGILNVGDTELTIICQLTDRTYFEAKDIIKVVDKAGLK